jgi:hypothetical protein
VALQNLYSLTTVVDPDTKQLIGQVIFQPWVPEGDYLLYFWSVDNHGASTIATPFKATFQFRSKASTNNPPSASFPPRGYGTSGAGIPAANGYFIQNGIFNLFPIYYQTGGSYMIFKFYNNGSPRWGIDTVLPEPPTATVDFTAIPYYTVNAVLPPEGVWTTDAANAGLAPSVFRVPISGNPNVGSLLTGHYIFSDPDGDDEVGSHYQWYRFSKSTDTDSSLATPIGSDAKTYTPIKDDLYKVDLDGPWLRLQVTPVDEHGAAGSPVLSDAVQVIEES